MNTFRTPALGAAIAGMVAPALLFIGAGTAQALQDVNDRLPWVAVGAFVPQPDPPGVIDPGSRAPQIIDPGSRAGILDPGSKIGIEDPGIKIGIVDPGLKVGIGGPDTRPAP